MANHLANGYKGEVGCQGQCLLTMVEMRVLLLPLLVALSTGAPSDPTSINPRENLSRSRFLQVSGSAFQFCIYFSGTFSLFSIVQFPNEICSVASTTGIYGTCLTS